MNDLYNGDLRAAEEHAKAWLEATGRGDQRTSEVSELAKFLMNGPQL